MSTVANSLWLMGCVSEFRRFRRGVRRVAQEQREILERVLAQNAGTEFGRRHGFSSCRSVSDYQRRVPLRDYEAYRDSIGRIADGVPNVLTHEEVALLEPTSGSAGASKRVPYTSSLRREFQKGIRAWVADLFLHSPELLTGPAYWSVSPTGTQPERTSGGIRVGFDDDSAYVGGWQRMLVRAVMAVPGQLRFVTDPEAFRYATILHLIRARNLRLVSIWHPAFFALILDRLPEWGDSLAHDLAIGGDGLRAKDLREALRAPTVQERHARLWPKLGLISCWADANAAAPAARLAELFPHARMQRKGLIATEGFVSLPLDDQNGAALAIRSHFLEFLPVDSSGIVEESPHLAHQLDLGGRYTVVLTTGGGLYRYRLGDLVEVTGRVCECPLIRFLGRQDYVSDWFGEKLNEAHVSQVLEETFRDLSIVPAIALLACEREPAPAGYVLYIDAPVRDEMLQRAAEAIDAGLCSNFHYSYARRLGQLASVRVFRAPGAAGVYLEAAARAGQRSGNVKPPGLEKRDGWSRILEGHFLAGRSQRQSG